MPMRHASAVLLVSLGLAPAVLGGEFDPDEAMLYLEYSRASFCDADKITSWKCGEACDYTRQNLGIVPGSVRLFGGESTTCGIRGYVVKLPVAGDQTTCLVAFRGSVNTENWITDAQSTLTEWPTTSSSEHGAAWCPGCNVHTGFAKAFDELWPRQVEEMQELQCDTYRIAGHSLGAALATVTAAYMRGTGHSVEVLWTFGSPRVGDTAFASAFVRMSLEQGHNPASWRVVHYHDPVPCLGPSQYFTHIPHEVWYQRDYVEGNNSQFEICPWNMGIFESTGNVTENPACGTFAMGTFDFADGLVYNDHVTYMGKTFALKNMETKCVAANVYKGYVSQGTSFGAVVFVSLLFFAIGFVAGRQYQQSGKCIDVSKDYCRMGEERGDRD